MTYDNIKKGKFVSRPNRFIAHIEVDGKERICHVKNTGRCKEILVKGATVYVQELDKASRKTQYDLISVYKGNRLINIDSHAPNRIAAGLIPKIFCNVTFLKPEARFRDSRFDFYFETDAEKAFMEVKGVTLEEDGVVMFPDAPTVRGIKHIRELIQCVREGYHAYVLFVVQMNDVLYFTPNYRTHEEFGEVLEEAHKSGVKILAVDCIVTEHSMTPGKFIPIVYRC